MKRQHSPKCPRVSHCPIPHRPGQWDRTGQQNNQCKIKEASNEQLFVTEL